MEGNISFPAVLFGIALTILYFFHPVKSKFNFYIIFYNFFFTFLGYCCILPNFLHFRSIISLHGTRLLLQSGRGTADADGSDGI